MRNPLNYEESLQKCMESNSVFALHDIVSAKERWQCQVSKGRGKRRGVENDLAVHEGSVHEGSNLYP